MNVGKLTPERKAYYCKRYTLIGAFLLPFVWLVSLFSFSPFALSSPPSPYRSTVRKCLLISFIGILLWTLILCSWEIAYQYLRSIGEEWTETLAFVLPLGKI